MLTIRNLLHPSFLGSANQTGAASAASINNAANLHQSAPAQGSAAASLPARTQTASLTVDVAALPPGLGGSGNSSLVSSRTSSPRTPLGGLSRAGSWPNGVGVGGSPPGLGKLVIVIPEAESGGTTPGRSNATTPASGTPIHGTTPKAGEHKLNPKPPLHPKVTPPYRGKFSPPQRSLTVSPPMPRFSLAVTPNNSWVSYCDIDVNKNLFDSGLTVIRPADYDDPEFVTNDAKLALQLKTSEDRTLRFISFTEMSKEMSKESKSKGEWRKVYETFQLITKRGGKNWSKVDPDIKFDAELNFGTHELTDAWLPIHSLIREYVGSDSRDLLLHNVTRRGETYFPFVLNGEKGMYAHPWFCDGKDPKSFVGAKKFVTAVCMLGSVLEAYFKNGMRAPFVIHNLEIPPSNPIVSVAYNSKTSNAYEAMFFASLETQLPMLKMFTADNCKPLVYFHVPDYDYILYAMGVYIQRGIEYQALSSLIDIIFKQSKIYREKITAICVKHGVLFSIESPLDNLFGNMRDLKKDVILAELTKLGVDNVSQEQTMEKFVASCVTQLRTNAHNKEHQAAWETIFMRYQLCENKKAPEPEVPKYSSIEIPKTIEQLLTLANAMMILRAVRPDPTQKYNENETVSILPISEKQIQVAFQQLFKGRKEQFNVLFLTYAESIICSAPNKKSTLFYLPPSGTHGTLVKLVTEHGILSHAQANVGRTSPVNRLADVLKAPTLT